jgi:hypothetical protein
MMSCGGSQGSMTSVRVQEPSTGFDDVVGARAGNQRLCGNQEPSNDGISIRLDRVLPYTIILTHILSF